MSQRQRVSVGTRKGLFLFDLEGAKSTLVGVHHLAVPVSATCVDNVGNLWACLDHGHWSQKLSRSADGGESWEAVPEPAYPEDATFANWGETGKPATLEYQWIITPGAKGDTVYMGTIPGGLFMWTGNTWALNEGLWAHPTRHLWFGGGMDNPGIHSVVIDPDDANHLMVALSCAGVFETSDGGKSWDTRNEGMEAGFLPNPEDDRLVGYDPHLVVRAPSDGNVLWQQNHCGRYVSRDCARSWQPASNVDEGPWFGFSIAVSPTRADTAWVVPARSDENRIALEDGLCLYRTEDFGKSWQRKAKGLPVEAYDLCLRHALDIQGETLVFGSTTGNLFVTPDGGESFHVISNHLPPIYSVEFHPEA